MMYSKNLFEMLSSMTENKRSTKGNYFSQKKLLMPQMCNLDQIAPNLCNSKSHDPLY